jgi:hypothetical protein
MRIYTNHDMLDISTELLEAGIWCVTVPNHLEPGEIHTTWCEMAESGHMGPCRANYLIDDVPGILGYTVVQHANGHMCIALPTNRRETTEKGQTRLMTHIHDLIAPYRH